MMGLLMEGGMENPDRKITARLVKRGEAEKEFDRAFWREVDSDTKFKIMWQMVVESYLFQGKDIAELRLQKSVENVRRRRR
jgi:hypothetical protein